MSKIPSTGIPPDWKSSVESLLKSPIAELSLDSNVLSEGEKQLSPYTWQG